MMFELEGNVLRLAGGLRVKARVQHPKVTQRKDRQGRPWIFRYYADELRPDGSTKVLRKYQEIGPSKGDGAITKKQAEIERDKFLAKLNAPTTEEAVQQTVLTGVALFGEVARMCEHGYLGRANQIAKPTRDKEKFYLDEYIVPQWGKFRLNQFQAKAVEDWLHITIESWWTMHGVRAIMSRVFYYAGGHGLWEEGKRSPASKAKIGKKRYKNERRILSFDETARVLARLEDPYLLIIETCIATGARISEVRWACSGSMWISGMSGQLRSNSESGTRTSTDPRAKTETHFGYWRLGRALSCICCRRWSGGVCVPAEAGARATIMGFRSPRCAPPSRGRGLRLSRPGSPFFPAGECDPAAAGVRNLHRSVENCFQPQ